MTPRKEEALWDEDMIAKLIKELGPLELLRIAPMPEAAHLAGAGEDTLIRNHPDRIVSISPRRSRHEGDRCADAQRKKLARSNATAA